MKIRSGFVSNSSSSSFIISVNKPEKCKLCGRSDHNFIDFVDSQSQGEYSHSDSTRVIARNSEKIVDYINTQMAFSNEERIQYTEVIKKMQSLEKNGKEIGFISIAYCDDITNQEFSIQKHKKAIVQLWP